MLSLVVPLYNEEENVTPVATALLQALRGTGIPFELILVDNGSRDGTAPAIDALRESCPEVRKVTVEVNQGFGWGVLQGLAAAKGDLVGYMGGDGQIDPSDVVRVVRRLERGDVPLAKVRRVRRQDGFLRLLVTLAANLLFRLLFGLRTTDVNGTPKIMRRALYQELDLRSRDWFVDAEVMIKCRRRRVPLAEVDVTFLPRERGTSNVRLSTLAEFLGNILRTLAGTHGTPSGRDAGPGTGE